MKTIVDLLNVTRLAWGYTFMHGTTWTGLDMVDLADDMICGGRY